MMIVTKMTTNDAVAYEISEPRYDLHHLRVASMREQYLNVKKASEVQQDEQEKIE